MIIALNFTFLTSTLYRHPHETSNFKSHNKSFKWRDFVQHTVFTHLDSITDTYASSILLYDKKNSVTQTVHW